MNNYIISCSTTCDLDREYLESNKMDSYVLGLSGGVDSSLVAAIARKAVGKDRTQYVSFSGLSETCQCKNISAIS